jgi:hypothetical protein
VQKGKDQQQAVLNGNMYKEKEVKMETYFKLEDYAKAMLLNSKKKKDKDLWKRVLELNKKNGNYLYIN